jgi:hypothetical protein
MSAAEPEKAVHIHLESTPGQWMCFLAALKKEEIVVIGLELHRGIRGINSGTEFG